MAWIRWFPVLGVGLLMATGCATPSPSTGWHGAPPNSKSGGMPPAQFPTSPTSKSGAPANSGPSPAMPPITSDNGMRIGSPSAQQTASNTKPAQLRPYEPSTRAPVASSSPTMSQNSGGLVPATMTSLPNMLPTNGNSFPQTGMTMPGAAAPTMSAPAFPAQPAMPAPTMPATPTPADNFPPPNMPGSNIPTAPNLNLPSATRSNLYPTP